MRLICDINEEFRIAHPERINRFTLVVGSDGAFPHKDALFSHYTSGGLNCSVYSVTIDKREGDVYAELLTRGAASRDFDLRGCVTLLFKNNELVDTKCDPPSEDAEDVEAA